MISRINLMMVLDLHSERVERNKMADSDLNLEKVVKNKMGNSFLTLTRDQITNVIVLARFECSFHRCSHRQFTRLVGQCPSFTCS